MVHIFILDHDERWVREPAAKPNSTITYILLDSRVVTCLDTHINVRRTFGRIYWPHECLPWRPFARRTTRPLAIRRPLRPIDGGADCPPTAGRGGRPANARTVLQGYPMEANGCPIRWRPSAIAIPSLWLQFLLLRLCICFFNCCDLIR